MLNTNKPTKVAIKEYLSSDDGVMQIKAPVHTIQAINRKTYGRIARDFFYEKMQKLYGVWT